MKRLLICIATLALAACAGAPRLTSMESKPAGGYEAEAGRDAAMIAEMRAAPAPAEPALVVGKNPSVDRSHLLAQGFVPIGHAHFAGDESSARNAALRLGREVGADRILLHAPSAPDDSPPAQDARESAWQVTYYVRFQLPFGATFRDLAAKERQTMGHAGVRIGSVVNGTPAARANLLAGDVIIALDGKAVSDHVQFRSMLRANAGRKVTLAIIRNGETLDRMVRLGITPDTSKR